MIKRILILLATLSVGSVSAMDSEILQRRTEQNEKQSNMRKQLIFPASVGRNPETIDLKETNEPIWHISLYDHIHEMFDETGLPFILARVETKNNSVQFVHYYDAKGLHQYLYGQNSIGRGASRYDNDSILVESNFFRNPANNLSIENVIHYFIIDGIDQEFRYLCSDWDLCCLGNGYLLTLFRSHDILVPGNTTPREVAQGRLGQIYYLGQGTEVDYERARGYFEVAAHQNDNLEAKEKAQDYLRSCSVKSMI